MKLFLLLFALASAALAQTITSQTANNTSACVSNGSPAYCTTGKAWTTDAAHTLAQTVTADPLPGHVSELPVRNLLYSGATTKMVAALTPWFGCSGHINIGMDETSSTVVAAQNDSIINRGFDIESLDFYGQDSSLACNLSIVNNFASDLSGRAGTPLKMIIREDSGATFPFCPKNGAGVDQTSCITTHLNSDMDYINTHYAGNGYYWKDAGHPVVMWFFSEASWTNPTPNWATIWASVVTHTNGFSSSFKHLFEYGSYTDPHSTSLGAGEFGWVKPPAYVNSSDPTSQQFWYCSPSNLAPTSCDNLYDDGAANPSKITLGMFYKGFDDSIGNFGADRYLAQQCGQVLIKSIAQVTHSGDYGVSNQLPYAMLVTWNDYEEGTEGETGIDNCYTVSASLSLGTLFWSLTASDATYASTSTIDHFKVWRADGSGNLTPVQDNISPATGSLNLAGLVPAGTWNMYVEMVGKPLIINRMSGANSFTVGVGTNSFGLPQNGSTVSSPVQNGNTITIH